MIQNSLIPCMQLRYGPSWLSNESQLYTQSWKAAALLPLWILYSLSSTKQQEWSFETWSVIMAQLCSEFSRDFSLSESKTILSQWSYSIWVPCPASDGLWPQFILLSPFLVLLQPVWSSWGHFRQVSASRPLHLLSLSLQALFLFPDIWLTYFLISFKFLLKCCCLTEATITDEPTWVASPPSLGTPNPPILFPLLFAIALPLSGVV